MLVKLICVESCCGTAVLVWANVGAEVSLQ